MDRKEYILSDQFIEDVHAQTAKDIFGEVTPDTRARAKNINYAEMYGVGDISTGLMAGRYPTRT